MNIPRQEHPKPQFMREDWINLNGEWEFCIDNECVGAEKHYENNHFDSTIIVPFCPESVLSGIGNTDFMNCVWYRRDIEIPPAWKGRRVLLHFGAVDYKAYVYVNGEKAGSHKGGYISFNIDITKYLKDSGNYITVCAVDDTRSRKQPSGKQSDLLKSHDCCYTRTTGIWQTVWLEAVPETYVSSAMYYPDIQKGGVEVRLQRTGNGKDVKCRLTASYEGELMGSAEVALTELEPSVYIDLKETHLWEVGQGRLYDLKIETFKDGELVDTINSYFGLRSVDLTNRAFKINGKTVFGRWVLDQGYYPDGIYTAPSDEALKNDILYSLQLGFNGARPHEKIFEERYFYWADKLGYLVWGEYPNWGYDADSMANLNCMLPEWMESVKRDFNHPSIIGWCPFNETWNMADDIPQSKEVVETVYNITKAMDRTRPVIDTSGNYHAKTDIFDVHDYEQDPVLFKENYDKIEEGIVNDGVNRSPKADYQHYDINLPVFVSEYGGIGWIMGGENAWGYGNNPKTEEEFIARYKGLTEALIDNPSVMAFCYTQLTDVEQEQNGLMTYDRKFKFDPEIFKKINTKKAAIEE